MSVEVVTVWAPRMNHEKWRDDYLPLLDLQRATAHRFGHKHTIMTDDSHMMEWADAVVTLLPMELMQAMIAGVVERLRRPVDSHLLFVDVDVLIHRNLESAFEGVDFDLGLTNRAHPTAPINNGVMLVPEHGAAGALLFFEEALRICGTHWGADQEAISKAASPIPSHLDRVVIKRPPYGRIGYLSMKSYAAVPKVRAHRHDRNPFCVHFKGETKAWAAEYAQLFILGGESGTR